MKPAESLVDKMATEPCEPPENPSGLPYPVRRGVLEIGGHKLRCYVLNDGRRIFNAQDIEDLFGVQLDRSYT